jgi:coenzyme F420-reducing hydrogenase alpha subunit
MSNKWGGKREGSGRPKGSLNKATLEVKELFKPHAEAAISVVSELMESSDTPSAVRLNAAKLMIERAWGKSTDYFSYEDSLAVDEEEYEESIKKFLSDDEYATLLKINEKLEKAGK